MGKNLLGKPESELPALIDSRLEFLKALRAAKVKSFAARALGEVSPETLKVITEYLNKDIAAHSSGKGRSATDQGDSVGGPPSIP